MFPSSLAVILTGVVLCGLALVAYVWAWRRGQFRDFEAQARVLFEPRDFRLDRPWERPEQRLERELLHGPLERPAAGEWGGAE